MAVNQELTKSEIVSLLASEGDAKTKLFERAAAVKRQFVKDKVYFRGLIEFSNFCSKNCLYCGIRKGNRFVDRFILSDEEILDAARFAWENRYGSIVMQSGEIRGKAFTRRITGLLEKIRVMSNGNLRVTLSCGEQSKATYREWFSAGASRYLLRIETSDRGLYYKIHPNDKNHSFDKRVQCLHDMKDIGYQLGTGVMIGLPFQTLEPLADDLLWIKALDADMIGMGPYIEHEHPPLAEFSDQLLPLEKRLELALKMIAVLRIMMPDINIAAATALQAIDKLGREKAIMAGANVIMPNVTPGSYRDSYKLYDNKPCTNENAEDCTTCLELRVALTKNNIAWGEWGDSQHYLNA
jgi:biotin synthase